MPQASRQAKTLGPVADLEAHLPDDWWRKIFNALYIKTDGDVVENDDNTRAEVDFLVNALGLTTSRRVLDLCCGQGRHVIELARRGFRDVHGLDRSRYLIRLAKKRAQAAGVQATFREGDARNPRMADDSFDAVSIFGNSFGYFSSQDDDVRVLKSIGRLLKPDGMLMLDLADGNWLKSHFERRSWEWIDAHHFVCRERSLASDGSRLVSREVIVHDTMGVLADQFYAKRLYTNDEIAKLLETCGYRHVRAHPPLETKSDRTQDLGMMAHRMLLTAVAPVKQKKVAARPTAKLAVTVLMGDPRLPDKVKLGGQFNPEDMRTIEELKSALETLERYDVSYLDNHASMMERLDETTCDFVFNLCDEGFRNDARKELHVPALLELHDIKYTGAGPQCLAACYDKALVRAVALQLDVPVPLESFSRIGDQGATLPSVFPAILKPNIGDSSEGITKDAVVSNQAEFVRYLEHLRTQFPDRDVLVQEFLTGSEYSVGIIGNPQRSFNVLPVLEVDYSGLGSDLPKILGYESKWDPVSPYWTQIRYKPATLSDRDHALIVDASIRMFERLGCRDYARFDFRADREGTIKLLEVNPNPGWCWDGKLNLMAGFAGMTYAGMLDQILAAAEERLELRGAGQRVSVG